MKYEQTKHKIKETWTDSKENLNLIDKENKKIYKIKENIKLNKTSLHSFKKISDYNVDFESMDIIEYDRLVNGTSYGKLYRLYKEWVIIFEKFPINLIPFIKYAVIYDNHPGLNEDDLEEEKSIIIQTEDIVTANGVVNTTEIKVTLIVGLWLSGISPYAIEAKLLINIFNPYNYV